MTRKEHDDYCNAAASISLVLSPIIGLGLALLTYYSEHSIVLSLGTFILGTIAALFGLVLFFCVMVPNPPEDLEGDDYLEDDDEASEEGD